MPTVTLRPNGTDANVGVSVVGAGTAHEALSDNSDSSYVTSIGLGDSLRLTMDDLSIPPGAVIQVISLRLRANAPSAAQTLLGIPIEISSLVGGSLSAVAFVAGTAIVTFNPGQPTPVNGNTGVAVSQDAINAMFVRFGNVNYNGSLVGFTGKVYELYFDVTYAEPPTVAVTGPTGTVTDSTTPTVTWAGTLDSSAGPQTRAEVRIFSAAQYGAGGFDPSTSASAADSSGVFATGDQAWQTPTRLANGNYRAYVRVGQSSTLMPTMSDWAYVDFTVNVLSPAVPTLTVTADSPKGRIRIDVDANAGDATTDQFEVQRSLDGGTTWTAIRTVDGAGIVAIEENAAYDYELGNAVTAIYRARAGHIYAFTSAFSDWVTSDPISWSGTSWWLKAPSNPALNVEITVDSLPSYQRSARQGSFQGLGAAYPIVVSDTRTSAAGGIRLWVETEEEQAALDALLDLGTPLLLQGIPGHHWTDRYVALGDHDRARIIDKSWIEPTFDSFPWVEVAMPVANVASWPDGLFPSESLLPSTTLYPA